MADVSKPIIGAHFLAHYGLLVDIRNKRLVDSTTTLFINGQVKKARYRANSMCFRDHELSLGV